MAQRTRDVEIAVRRVRWFAVPFALVQFALFSPVDGGALPFPRWPVAILYAIVLLGTNLVSLWAARNASPELLRRIGLVELFVDTTLVVGIVILFGFDDDSRMWPLLSFPIVEGAMRAQLRGAMLTWVYGAGAYVIDQLVRLPGRENPAAWIGSIPWGAGILLFIGLGTGILARRVQVATLAQAADAARLRRLAERSRQINAPRRLEDVFGEAASAARELTDLSRVALYERLGDGRWVRRAQSGTRGRVGDDAESIEAFDELVERIEGPTEIELSGAMAERTQRLVPDARRVWAAPLEHEGRLTGLLLIAQGADEPTPDEAVLPLLGLLASLASVAVDNARLSEAEERTILELRELDRLKDDFFSILAHELRSPVSSVSGAAELLTTRFDSLPPERRQQLLRLVRDGSYRLNSLVQDVYDAMRAERLELPINTAPTPLAPLIREIATDEVGRSSAHDLALDLDPLTPPAFVDPQRFHQIIQNLVANAVKYSPEGGVVSVRLCQDNGQVVVEVEDEGIGIDERAQTRLFRRFERVHADSTIQGTGLGLYLVRTLTEAMGGEVSVDSRPGHGSVFTVRFAAAGEEPPD